MSAAYFIIAWIFDLLLSIFMIPINTRLFWWEPELTSRGRAKRCGINNCYYPKDARATGWRLHVACQKSYLGTSKGKDYALWQERGHKESSILVVNDQVSDEQWTAQPFCPREREHTLTFYMDVPIRLSVRKAAITLIRVFKAFC